MRGGSGSGGCGGLVVVVVVAAVVARDLRLGWFGHCFEGNMEEWWGMLSCVDSNGTCCLNVKLIIIYINRGIYVILHDSTI